MHSSSTGCCLVPHTNNADIKSDSVFYAADRERSVFNQCCLEGPFRIFRCGPSSALQSWTPASEQHCRSEHSTGTLCFTPAGTRGHGPTPEHSLGLAREGKSHCSETAESTKLQSKMKGGGRGAKGKYCLLRSLGIS